LSGLNIERRVADKHRTGHLRAERLQGVLRKCRIGLEPGGVAGAEHSTQIGACSEVLAEGAGCASDLVRQHGAGNAAVMERSQQFYRAGKQLGVIQHGPVEVGSINAKSISQLARLDKPKHGLLQPAADRVADRLERGGRQAQLGERMTITSVDRRKVVKQGAIKIEESRAERHDQRCSA